jgi:hypothetical protein
MELPEANKSSAADKPENKKKANWMQVRKAAAACPLFKAASRASSGAAYNTISVITATIRYFIY